MECPYQLHAPQTQEGWQAWEIVIQVTPLIMSNVRGSFPLEAALNLATAHQYPMWAMAELLPAAATGLALAQLEQEQKL